MLNLTKIHFVKKSLISLFLSVCLALPLISPALAFDDRGPGKFRHCLDEQGIPSNGFNGTFNPLENRHQASEYEFEITNEHCLGQAIGYAAAVLPAMIALKASCQIPETTPVISTYPRLLNDMATFVQAGKKAATNEKCAITLGITTSLYSSVVLTVLGTQYERAKKFYHNTKVCGSEWIAPDSNVESKSFSRYSTGPYQQKVIEDTKEIDCSNTSGNENNARKCRELLNNGMEFEDNPGDGSEPCLDPTNSNNPQKYYLRGLLPGTFNCEKYRIGYNTRHVSGSAQEMSQQQIAEYNKAYACCRKRSREYMCLNYSTCTGSEEECSNKRGNRVFCRDGQKCSLKNDDNVKDYVVLDVERRFGNLLCAQSYNFCPFNFSVGGGTDFCARAKDAKLDMTALREDGALKWSDEIMINHSNLEREEQPDDDNILAINNRYSKIADVDCEDSYIRDGDCKFNQRAGTCVNYCQVLRNCTIVSGLDNEYPQKYSSPYMSIACHNFVGDTRNTQSSTSGFIGGFVKNFSAPIAQCVKETMENLFNNKVGHSRCLSPKESPDVNGLCNSGYVVLDATNELVHQQGTKAKEKSFFEYIQFFMKDVVKAVLTLSILLYGGAVLMGVRDLGKKEEIMVYIFKIAVIIYFALGDAWKEKFFQGLYDIPSTLSSSLMKISVSKNEKLRDGCQFGVVTYPDGTTDIATTYPPGKQYLAMWDTLDCKLMHYLGFGVDSSIANIAMIILAGLFSGPIGFFFALSALIFGIILIVLIIKALYIFLGSTLAIIIMVFVSPIVFLMLLFDKTKDGFDGWLKNLIGFALQPVLLTAYIFIVVTTMDKVLVGSATFNKISSSSLAKKIDCREYCISPAEPDTILMSDDPGFPGCLDTIDHKHIYPLTDSVACLIVFDGYGSIPILSHFGISLPVLENLLSGKGGSTAGDKILTLLRGLLIMYILNHFINQIPGIASALTGSKSLPGVKADAKSILTKSAGIANAVGKRAAGLAKQSGKGANKLRKKMNKRNSAVGAGQAAQSSHAGKE